MKSLLCVALFTILSVCGVNAQDAVGPEEAPHRLVDDAWALQFGIHSHTLTSLLGSTISAKHHVSASRALRYGLTVGGAYQHRDEIGGFYHLDVRLTMQFLSYPTLAGDPDGRIQLFYGVGPEVSVSTRGIPDGAAGHADGTQFGIGVAGVIGAEWFVKERISLSGEYRSSLSASRGRETTEISLRPFHGGFGLSVYF